MPIRPARGRRAARPAIAALALLSFLPALGACGDEDDRGRSVPTVTADPTDRPDDDKFAFSNEVAIREGSVSPAQTVALVDRAIVLRNTTSVPQSVRATNGRFGDTGPVETTIEPGGSFSFRQSTPLSITYEVTSQPGLNGRIQVDPGTDTI